MQPGTNIIKKVLNTISLSQIARAGVSKTIFPYQHLVSDERLLHVQHLFPYKSISQFKADLDSLLSVLKPVGVQELISEIQTHNRLPKNTFLLTFDDGLKEIYEIVAPILYAKGIPALFFITPGYIDNKNHFFRHKVSLVIDSLLKVKSKTPLDDFASLMSLPSHTPIDSLIKALKNIHQFNQAVLDDFAALLNLSFKEYFSLHRPFMLTKEMHDLHRKGFSFGAHSMDHSYYDLLSVKEQVDQTIQSARMVQHYLDQPFNFFAFPFNDAPVTQSFFQSVEEQNFYMDLYFGIQYPASEWHNRVIHRFSAEDPRVPMEQLLKQIFSSSLVTPLRYNQPLRRQR